MSTGIQPRITHFSFSSSVPRKRYNWGDTRMRGKTELIIQPVIYRDGSYAARRGKILTEWVKKGSVRDHNHPDWKIGL